MREIITEFLDRLRVFHFIITQLSPSLTGKPWTKLSQHPFSCDHSSLIFDRSIVRSTLTDVMGFTCEDDYLFSIFNAGYMLGMLTGAFVLGILSDKASFPLKRDSAFGEL